MKKKKLKEKLNELKKEVEILETRVSFLESQKFKYWIDYNPFTKYTEIRDQIITPQITYSNDKSN